MSTYIYVPDTDEWAGDYGNFTSYAGPAYVYGKGHCVSWGGNIANVYVSVENSNCAALQGAPGHRDPLIRLSPGRRVPAPPPPGVRPPSCR